MDAQGFLTEQRRLAFAECGHGYTALVRAIAAVARLHGWEGSDLGPSQGHCHTAFSIFHDDAEPSLAALILAADGELRRLYARAVARLPSSSAWPGPDPLTSEGAKVAMHLFEQELEASRRAKNLRAGSKLDDAVRERLPYIRQQAVARAQVHLNLYVQEVAQQAQALNQAADDLCDRIPLLDILQALRQAAHPQHLREPALEGSGQYYAEAYLVGVGLVRGQLLAHVKRLDALWQRPATGEDILRLWLAGVDSNAPASVQAFKRVCEAVPTEAA